MKKIFFFIIGIIAVIAFFIWRKARAALNLTIDVGDFQFIKNGLLDYQVKLNVILKNYSSTELSINQIKTEIYTNKNVLLLEQDKPLTKSYTAKANSVLKIPVLFNLDTTGVINFLTSSGIINSWADLGNALKKYANTGEFGIPLIVSGFVQAEGLQYKFNETINV